MIEKKRKKVTVGKEKKATDEGRRHTEFGNHKIVHHLVQHAKLG
jgi:hypothetical protein